jgi:nitrogen regulatory protein P-II 1
MKLVKAYIHHVRTGVVIQSLADAGYRRLAVFDVRGTLKALSADEQDYSADGTGILIGEVQVELVCEDCDVAAVTAIVATSGRIGPQISGWIYVSPIEQALPIGGSENGVLAR